ncbi:MAG: T9SS type A sorting domain-containing protein, partial [Weeksellaceae bacterium]|nr:T9SS type A sorting domain-containing protein [Weeksellaceae bacterium]
GNPTIWKNSTGINTLDTNEPTAINEIMVYPNPASTEITIEIQNNKNSLITLTDMTGKQVYSGDFHGTKMSLNVERYAKGIYILTVFSRQHTYFKKIIIN